MTCSYEMICQLENLFLAWEKFRRGKRKKREVLEYEFRLEDNLFELQEEFLSRHYQHGNYEPFFINDPKRRQIHKSSVKDRIVHQVVVNVIEPLFEKRFIFDSYSCRVGKGTHAAVHRLHTFLQTASMNNTKMVYALKCDIRKFFASVDHMVLCSLIQKRISDARVLKLLEGIIESFSASVGRGIPLGNLTSQLFANIYLHELDWFIKMKLRERFYLRYCDDFIILGYEPKRLHDLIDTINRFLEQELLLSLHPKKVFIRSWGQGIDFLGYILLPHATVMRTKTADRMLKRVNKDNSSSYLGLCGHADAYELEQIIRTKIGTR